MFCSDNVKIKIIGYTGIFVFFELFCKPKN